MATGVPFPFNPLIKGIWKFLNEKCILFKKSSGFAKDFHVNNYEFYRVQFNLITIIFYWLMFMMEIYPFLPLFPLLTFIEGEGLMQAVITLLKRKGGGLNAAFCVNISVSTAYQLLIKDVSQSL